MILKIPNKRKLTIRLLPKCLVKCKIILNYGSKEENGTRLGTFDGYA
jgi:hypothetical protein